MSNMIITSVQHLPNSLGDENSSLVAIINGVEMYVPIDPANRHYAEIIRQVEAGTLTIQAAD